MAADGLDEQTVLALRSYLGTLITIRSGPDGVQVVGCDHTLNKSTLWLLARGGDVAAGLEWLLGRGAFCDCEVLLNVDTA